MSRVRCRPRPTSSWVLPPDQAAVSTKNSCASFDNALVLRLALTPSGRVGVLPPSECKLEDGLAIYRHWIELDRGRLKRHIVAFLESPKIGGRPQL